MGEPGGFAVYGVAQSWTRLKWLSSSIYPRLQYIVAQVVHWKTTVTQNAI